MHLFRLWNIDKIALILFVVSCPFRLFKIVSEFQYDTQHQNKTQIQEGYIEQKGKKPPEEIMERNDHAIYFCVESHTTQNRIYIYIYRLKTHRKRT